MSDPKQPTDPAGPGKTERQEFAPDDLTGALKFIEAMPAEFRRVHVDVWKDGSGWSFVLGDERRYVRRLLGVVVGNRRFRLKGITDSLHDTSFTSYSAQPTQKPNK